MNDRIVGKLISALILVFLFCYIIYSGVRYFYSPYQTETAYLYTVAETYRTDAIAVRDEVLLSQPADELLSYVRKDGEVVKAGAVVAHIYKTEQDAVNTAQLERINSEIELLKKAQASSADILRIELLNAELNDSVEKVVKAVASRNLKEINTLRDKVQLALGQYRVSTGRDDGYQRRIAYLNKKANELSVATNAQYDVVTTDIGGYFSSAADGYEELLQPELEGVSAKELEKLINGNNKPKKPDSAGKIQIGHDWYYAAVIPKEELYRFKKGVSVELDLGIENCDAIPALIADIREEESGDAIVMLKTSYINETLISERTVKLEIRFKSYSGLRISSSALRYDGLTEGVYVKNGNLINFKAIERIYTDEDFILCKSAAVIEDEEDGKKHYEPLKQFDEIIVKGTELYDGKVI